MPYLSVMRISGDPDELVAGYETISAVMGRVAPENGIISHVAAKTDDGLLIVNLWESKEGSEATAEHPDVQKAREDSGVPPERVTFEHYETLNYQQP